MKDTLYIASIETVEKALGIALSRKPQYHDVWENSDIVAGYVFQYGEILDVVFYPVLKSKLVYTVPEGHVCVYYTNKKHQSEKPPFEVSTVIADFLD